MTKKRIFVPVGYFQQSNQYHFQDLHFKIMKSIRITLALIAAVVGALVASAQQAPVEAVISVVEGSATFTAPGSTSAVPAVVGQKLPEGSTVITGESSILLITSFDGIQTGLDAKSTAVIGTHSVNAEGVRTVIIDLKAGSSVSGLDPSKRKINNYGVRTPRGVAAARGTVYVTTYNGGLVTVDTVAGTVVFSSPGAASVTVPSGNSKDGNGAVVKLSSANKNSVLTAIKLLAVLQAAFPKDLTLSSQLANLEKFTKDNNIATGSEIAAAEEPAADVQVATASGDTQNPDQPVIIKTTDKTDITINVTSPSS